MKGRIVIELELDHTPETGSGLPDIAHNAYDLRKHIEAFVWTDKNTGKEWKLAEHWTVVRLAAEALA
jgi:hypothetical protein